MFQGQNNAASMTEDLAENQTQIVNEVGNGQTWDLHLWGQESERALPCLAVVQTPLARPGRAGQQEMGVDFANAFAHDLAGYFHGKLAP